MRGKAAYARAIWLGIILHVVHLVISSNTVVIVHIKIACYICELYSQSKRLVRQSSCCSSGKPFTEMQHWSVKCKLCVV